MSVPFKPHTWTVSQRESSQDATHKVRTTGVWGDAQSVRGLIQPVSSTYAYEQFGIEESCTHVALFETADEALHRTGAKVEWLGREYRIVSPPKSIRSVLALDHCTCLLNEYRTEDV